MTGFKVLEVKGLQMILDDDDFERLKDTAIYIVTKPKPYFFISKSGKSIRLHRFLMNVTDPKLTVDHRNGDTLDNRKSNLRVCSQTENTKNRSKSDKAFTSKYKGVYRNANRWVACIRVNYKGIQLGRFKTEDEAAEAYNKAAVKYFGEFAKVNVI